MTDDQWLRAIRKYDSERLYHHRLDDGFRGGATELARDLGARVKDAPERFARPQSEVSSRREPCISSKKCSVR